MPIEIVVPQVGEAVSEVILVEWLKKEGDKIKKGEPLFEVDTDKAVVEVEAFADGTLLQILVPDSSPVMPQQVVGMMLPKGEEIEAHPASALEEGKAEKTLDSANGKASPLAQRVAHDLNVELNSIIGTGPGGRIKVEDVHQFATGQNESKQKANDGAIAPKVAALPKARKVAKELNVDLLNVTGTGVDGLITVKDVKAASQMVTSEIRPASSQLETAVNNKEVQPFSRLRQAIARKMQASKQTVPHFYLVADVDMSQANHLRSYCQQTLAWERPPTYTDIIVRVCALSLASMPRLNSYYTEQGLAQRDRVDIGIAVGVEDGLIVPVLPRVDHLDLKETSSQLRSLIERTKQGRLRESDLSQKSMVVSNLGMYGVDAFTAIIDPPDPMILAVGQVAERVVPIEGQIAIRPMCTMTLSADHRVLDGVLGAQFLMHVKSILENPFEILGGAA